MKFIKKSVVVEAIKWTGKNLREITTFVGCFHVERPWIWPWETYEAFVCEKGLQIFTSGAFRPVAVGDWIIKNVEREVYPCKPDVFVMTYEPVGDSAAEERSAETQPTCFTCGHLKPDGDRPQCGLRASCSDHSRWIPRPVDQPPAHAAQPPGPDQTCGTCGLRRRINDVICFCETVLPCNNFDKWIPKPVVPPPVPGAKGNWSQDIEVQRFDKILGAVISNEGDRARYGFVFKQRVYTLSQLNDFRNGGVKWRFKKGNTMWGGLEAWQVEMHDGTEPPIPITVRIFVEE